MQHELDPHSSLNTSGHDYIDLPTDQLPHVRAERTRELLGNHLSNERVDFIVGIMEEGFSTQTAAQLQKTFRTTDGIQQEVLTLHEITSPQASTSEHELVRIATNSGGADSHSSAEVTRYHQSRNGKQKTSRNNGKELDPRGSGKPNIATIDKSIARQLLDSDFVSRHLEDEQPQAEVIEELSINGVSTEVPALIDDAETTSVPSNDAQTVFYIREPYGREEIESALIAVKAAANVVAPNQNIQQNTPKIERVKNWLTKKSVQVRSLASNLIEKASKRPLTTMAVVVGGIAVSSYVGYKFGTSRGSSTGPSNEIANTLTSPNIKPPTTNPLDKATEWYELYRQNNPGVSRTQFDQIVLSEEFEAMCQNPEQFAKLVTATS